MKTESFQLLLLFFVIFYALSGKSRYICSQRRAIFEKNLTMHRLSKALLSISLLLLAAGPTSLAARDNCRFRTFSPRGGFYFDGVADIAQDAPGFIWVLLGKEVLRFDGYEYSNYSASFRESAALGDYDFLQIETGEDGAVYVLTTEALFSYSKEKDIFEKQCPTTASSIYLDGDNKLWCASRDSLMWFDPQSKTMISAKCGRDAVKGVRYFSQTAGRVFFASEDGHVWAGKRGDSIGSLTELSGLDGNARLLGMAGYEDALWVLKEDHMVSQMKIQGNRLAPASLFRIKDLPPTRAFCIDQSGILWIGTSRGLFTVDTRTGQQQGYIHAKSDPFSLPNNSVWSILCDRNNKTWLGHFGGMLSYADPDDNLKVKTFSPETSPLSEGLVSCFALDGKYLWIGTEGGGINLYDLEEESFSCLRHDDHKSGTLSSDNIKSMAEDGSGRLWVALFKGGLDCLDLNTKRVEKNFCSGHGREKLLGDNLKKIVCEEGRGLWIAYQINQAVLSFLPFSGEPIRHYNLGGEDEYVFDLALDKADSALWVLTSSRLIRVNPVTGESREMAPRTEPLGGCSIYPDQEGIIWIGTLRHGLVKYDTVDDTFTSVGKTDLLHIASILSIVEDNGVLWMGTDNGLLCYDKADGTFRVFDEGDGFQGQVYYPLAALSDGNAHLYFGGTNGFSMFDAVFVPTISKSPSARISQFYLGHAPSPLAFDNEDSQTIRLSWDQSDFGFKLSSDDYLNPNEVVFRYRLEGYDSDWLLTDADSRVVRYAKVPAGKYVFRVQAADSDGRWGKETIIRLSRARSPWTRWWAWLLYGLAGLVLACSTGYWILEKRRLERQLYEDDLDKRKREELHQAQLSFFTNISHDFRTPLSLILASLDNLGNDGPHAPFYKIMRNNSKRLLGLIDELMDFRKAESKMMKLAVRPLEIESFVEGVAADFSDYARKRGVSFSWSAEGDMPDHLFLDASILDKVLVNLLNNAFKNTPDGGEIKIKLYPDHRRFVPQFKFCHRLDPDRVLSDEFLLVVQDNGVGISSESIGDIFDRYYTVDHTPVGNHLGTGIGLALVKSLVQLHKGTVSVFSERGKGTEFAVYLPANPGVYAPEDYASSESLSTTVTAVTASDSVDSPTNIWPGEMLPGASRSRESILLVEDNSDLRSLLSGFLSLHYNVREASDGKEALSLIADREPDLVISDVIMPEMDGIALCRQIKEDIETSHIPVVLLTAKVSDEARLEGTGSGADLYLTKPVDFRLLLLTIRNIFRHRQNLKEYYARNYWTESSALSVSRQDEVFLKKLTAVIEQNLKEATVNVDRIASDLCMSRTKLFQKVKKLTGKNIVEFMLNYRLRKAARLLKEGHPVGEVVGEVGLRSRSWFDKAFKKEFGITPAAFIQTSSPDDQ